MDMNFVNVELSLDDLYCLKAGIECAIAGTLMDPPDDSEQTAVMLKRIGHMIERCTYHPSFVREVVK